MSADHTRDISAAGQRRPLSPDYDRVPASEARRRQRSLGVRLRDLYAGIVEEPAPEDFLAILARADARARSPGGR